MITLDKIVAKIAAIEQRLDGMDAGLHAFRVSAEKAESSLDRIERQNDSDWIKTGQQLAAIEQGQDILCERLDGLITRQQEIAEGVQKDLEQIKGALLHEQFRKGVKRGKRKKR